MYKQILLIFALAMAAAFASELGYKGYNDYGYNHGYNNHYDLGDSYNNYGYNSYGYNSYGYDSHRLHRRSPTASLPSSPPRASSRWPRFPSPSGSKRGVVLCLPKS